MRVHFYQGTVGRENIARSSRFRFLSGRLAEITPLIANIYPQLLSSPLERAKLRAFMYADVLE